MPSNVINRQTIRETLATLIDTALDSTWDVFNYGTSIFQGKARNVIVASMDADRPDEGAGDVVNSDSIFFFGIGIFILYADDAQNWTAQNSEDALDLGEKKITDVIKDNRDNASWYRLTRMGRSRPAVSYTHLTLPTNREV